MSTQPSHPRFRILLDTNVLLDYYLASRKGHGSARKLITHAVLNDIPLHCAATSLKDFFYLYCLSLKRAMREEGTTITEQHAATISTLGWGCLNNIEEIATVAAMGPGDAIVAAKLRTAHEDFEDNFILATAMRCEVTHIATSDLAMQKQALVPALCCDDLLGVITLFDERP